MSQVKYPEETPLPGEDALQQLPKKLQEKLMPFQREGVCFALSRNGRSVHSKAGVFNRTRAVLNVLNR